MIEIKDFLNISSVLILLFFFLSFFFFVLQRIDAWKRRLPCCDPQKLLLVKFGGHMSAGKYWHNHGSHRQEQNVSSTFLSFTLLLLLLLLFVVQEWTFRLKKKNLKKRLSPRFLKKKTTGKESEDWRRLHVKSVRSTVEFNLTVRAAFYTHWLMYSFVELEVELSVYQ